MCLLYGTVLFRSKKRLHDYLMQPCVKAISTPPFLVSPQSLLISSRILIYKHNGASRPLVADLNILPLREEPQCFPNAPTSKAVSPLPARQICIVIIACPEGQCYKISQLCEDHRKLSVAYLQTGNELAKIVCYVSMPTERQGNDATTSHSNLSKSDF